MNRPQRRVAEKLPDAVLEGELVMLDDQGKPVFEGLRRRALMTPRSRTPDQQAARIFAFDILYDC